MKSKNLNLKRVWKQFEDHLVPRLRLNIVDRAVWSHLFRHSRLEGKGRLRFFIAWLGRGTRLCDGPVRAAVRRLVEKGALRLIEPSKSGHVVEVRLPEEVRAAGPPDMEAANETVMVRAANIEELDFLKTKALRQAIHAREHGLCFLLSATDEREQEMPRPCCGSCESGAEFLSKSGFLLCGMQLKEGGKFGPRFSSLAVPRAALDGKRTHRAPAGP